MILAHCETEEAVNYKGKALYIEKPNGKRTPVKLSVTVDNAEEAVGKVNGSVFCVQVKGSLKGSEAIKSGVKVFKSVKAGQEAWDLAKKYPNVTFLLSLPEGFNNLRQMSEICRKYSNINLNSGRVLALNHLGIRVGRLGKPRKGVVLYEDRYDHLKDVELAEIIDDLVVEDRAEKVAGERVSGGGRKKSGGRKPRFKVELGIVEF